MFKKLISNLPFNPSLIDQVTFYSKRLRKEAGIRRAGFALVALTMAVQVFATLAPAQASVSCDPSGNDIVQCGFKTKAEAINRCNGNGVQDREFRAILLNYGITCQKLSSSREEVVNSTANNNQLISIGRKAFQKPNETQVNVPGVGNLFWRPLSSWGNFNSRMLVTSTDDGQLVMVMFECGNLVTKSDFKKKIPEPAPKLNIIKTNTPKGDVAPGEILDYNLTFTNKGGTAAFFSVDDILPSQVTYVSSQNYGWTFENKAPSLKWSNKTPYYTFGNTDAFGTPGRLSVKVKVNKNVPNGTVICNRAYVAHLPSGSKTFQKSPESRVCNTVRIKCRAGQILGPDGLTCKPVTVPDAVCSSLTGILAVRDNQDNNKYEFEAKSKVFNGAKITSYNYSFGDGSTKVNKSSSLSDKVTHQYKNPGDYNISVKVQSTVADKPALTCLYEITVNKPGAPALAISKKAANITQKQADANGQTAQAGDVIEYSLTTSNISNVDYKNAPIASEDLADVLEYSTLDLNTLAGGVFDSKTNTLSWNETPTIKARESFTKKFRVTVKSPIPSTPRPATLNNRSSGDLVMQNVYGNSVEIKLPGTPIKTVETINGTMPKTGPGESLLVGFILMTVVGYFFARSRLLAKELSIVKNEYATTNGGL